MATPIEKPTSLDAIVPEKIAPTKSVELPGLLKGYENLHVKTGHFVPSVHGCAPHRRPIKDYIKYGVINLDKPANPSSHEVVSWVKRILRYGVSLLSPTLKTDVLTRVQ